MLHDRFERVLEIMIHEGGDLSDYALEVFIEAAQHGLGMLPSDDADITLDRRHEFRELRMSEGWSGPGWWLEK